MTDTQRTARLDAFERDAPRAVNFEFPISKLPTALAYIATHNLIEPVGLHLHSTAQWANDGEIQCCATAWTKATDEQWTAYCEAFDRECVSIVDPYLASGECTGPNAWPFEPEYFIHPTQPRHIKG